MKIRFPKIVVVLFVVIFFITLGMGRVCSAKVIKWKMPTGYPQGMTLWDYFAEGFAKHVKTISNGRLVIEPFPAGTVAPAFKVTDAVKGGVAEAGNTWAPYEVGRDPTTVLFGGGPGGLNSEKMFHWYYEGGGEKLLQQWRLETSGVVSFLLGLGPSEIIHSNKRISSLEDFKGLKMRTSGAWAEIIPGLGASAVILPAAEIFPALEKKVVDAVEWADPGTNLPLGFHQVAKYIIIPGVHQPSFPWELVINKKKWEELPVDLKEVVKAAAKLTTLDSWVKLGYGSMKAMVEFEKGGNEIVVLSDEVVKKTQQLADEWAEAKAAKNPWFKKVYESQKTFRSAWDKAAYARAK